MTKLSARLRRTLEMARDDTDRPAGMYPGVPLKMAPNQFWELRQLGFVKVFEPHNPVHSARAVITASGRRALEESKP